MRVPKGVSLKKSGYTPWPVVLDLTVNKFSVAKINQSEYQRASSNLTTHSLPSLGYDQIFLQFENQNLPMEISS